MASRNRGKRKPSIHDLSRTPPTDEERKAVRESLRDMESPIATAILASSVVEYELETELRAKFRRSNDETWKALTGDIGPLGTFYQKILAAYGFGIVGETVKDGMHTIRRIRNQFAHAKRLFDFDHELVTSELKSVTLPKAKKSKLYKDLSKVRALKGGPRECYVKLCLIIGLQLLERRARRIKAKSARSRLRRRRKMFSDALRETPSTSKLGRLGFFGGLPPVDPKNTIIGEAAFDSPRSLPNDDGKQDK